MFHLPNGAIAAATMIHKLHHNLWEPARTVNIVPSLVDNSLLSTVKMVEASYMPIYDDKEVNFYNTTTTKIMALADAILKGWQCPRAKWLHVPLDDNFRNENMDTLLLDHLHKHDCLNMLYKVESTTTTWKHINTIMLQAIGREYIHNVYALPSIEPTNRYLHVVAGFPMEETWLKVVQQGNYNSWPLINVRNVARYFPKSEEMQRDTCAGNDRVYAPPKRKHLTYFLPLPPHPHMKAKMIYLFASTSLRRQCTPIKWVVPTSLQSRQQIHHGDSQYQQQLFVGRGPQGQHWRQTYPGLCTSPGANAKGGHCPETPSPGQPSISGIQEGHLRL
jgi:hypothetical protein